MSLVMMEIKMMELVDSTIVPVKLMDGIVQVETLQRMIHEQNCEVTDISHQVNNEKTATLTVLTDVARHVKQKTDGTESTTQK